ncbi:DUF349 domain-containing protein [Rathayibacter sp. VKM Ac-2928]|uniref:DUF349 domain-containing protein n=1 Tax=Rathayibacter sp. VKM Ac-2928 TaxID=2929479 RepID=UPI0027E10716|nr:DUF349 domain-containing protein [Rathayibacter sp. VKM Ac-2928]
MLTPDGDIDTVSTPGTVSPDDSASSETTDAPESTGAPEGADAPAETDAPETGEGSPETATPGSETATPDEVAAPEEAAASDKTAPSEGETTTSDETATSGEAATADETTAPENAAPPVVPTAPRPQAGARQPWGRVADDGTVYVRVGDEEREVGQYPDATPEEALAYYERKYTELAGQVSLLEQRAKRGAPANDVSRGVQTLTAAISQAHAVGDLDALQARVSALSGSVEDLTEQQAAETKAALSDAIAHREAIVAEAEALAAVDPAKTQWKQASAAIDDLFARWQSHQQQGPRLPKNDANELWRRFRGARTTIEQNRKAFFADLDSAHREAKQAKQSLIDQADALVSRGAEAIPEYRALLERWRVAGRAGKRFDDALWARFKAAGDAIYGAKAEVVAQESVEYTENLDLKLALLEEAEPLLQEQDREKAKRVLLSVQERWDAVGRVPREQVRTVEDRLRKVEAHVRKLDEEHWNRSNPERKARSEGLASQLTAAIQKLQDELDEAKARGDRAAIAQAQEALDARKVWLDALG